MKNSSAVTPANMPSPNPTTTSAQQTDLFGVFVGELVKLHADNAIEKTTAASMNTAKICVGDADLVESRMREGIGMWVWRNKRICMAVRTWFFKWSLELHTVKSVGLGI